MIIRLSLFEISYTDAELIINCWLIGLNNTYIIFYVMWIRILFGVISFFLLFFSIFYYFFVKRDLKVSILYFGVFKIEVIVGKDFFGWYFWRVCFLFLVCVMEFVSAFVWIYASYCLLLFGSYFGILLFFFLLFFGLCFLLFFFELIIVPFSVFGKKQQVGFKKIFSFYYVLKYLIIGFIIVVISFFFFVLYSSIFGFFFWSFLNRLVWIWIWWPVKFKEVVKIRIKKFKCFLKRRFLIIYSSVLKFYIFWYSFTLSFIFIEYFFYKYLVLYSILMLTLYGELYRFGI